MPISIKDCLTSEEKVKFLEEEQKRLSGQAVDQEDNIKLIPAELEKWKKTSIINGFQGKDLDISGQKGWKNTLVIKDCPQLEYVDCSDLISTRKLEALVIQNCPNLIELVASNNRIRTIRFKEVGKLETIYLNNNKLVKFDASILPSIKRVDVSANQLISLNLTNCNELEILNCGINKLTQLDCSSCPNLKNLYCWYNKELNDLDFGQNLEILSCQSCKLEELNCAGMTKLRELYCFGKFSVPSSLEIFGKYSIKGLEILSLDGCESLEILDCAESCLGKCSLYDQFPNLRILSIKQNSLKEIIIKNLPQLRYLDFSFQGFFHSEDGKELNFSKRISPWVLVENCPNLEEIYHPKKFFFINEDENMDSFKKNFPNLRICEEYELENSAFEEANDKKNKEKEEEEQRRLAEQYPPPEDEGYRSGSEEEKPIPLCSWRLPPNKASTKSIDLPHKGLTGKLIIADYPNLTFVNVGNNDLQALIIRNCPKLRRLIYAHNDLVEPQAEISECPKLTSINNYKCQGGWEKPNLNEEEQKQWESQLNQEWESESGRKEELTEEENFARLTHLINSIETALAQHDLTQATQDLTELKELAAQPNSLIESAKLNATIADLEARLLSASSHQINQSESVPAGLIIGSISISCLVIGLMFWIINKKIKQEFWGRMRKR